MKKQGKVPIPINHTATGF